MSSKNLTEKAIEDSFKELMKTNPFEKITITDITDNCSLNRQTFYYHYQDKYELLNRIYQKDIIAPFQQDLSFDTWNKKLLNMFVTMQKDSAFYKNAFLHSNNEFRDFFLSAATSVFRDATQRLQQKAKQIIPAEQEIFIAEFFAYGITGTVIQWVNNSMREQPEELAQKINNLVLDCQKVAIDRYFGTL